MSDDPRDVPEPLYVHTLAECAEAARQAERDLFEATGKRYRAGSYCGHDHSAELAARETPSP